MNNNNSERVGILVLLFSLMACGQDGSEPNQAPALTSDTEYSVMSGEKEIATLTFSDQDNDNLAIELEDETNLYHVSFDESSNTLSWEFNSAAEYNVTCGAENVCTTEVVVNDNVSSNRYLLTVTIAPAEQDPEAETGSESEEESDSGSEPDSEIEYDETNVDSGNEPEGESAVWNPGSISATYQTDLPGGEPLACEWDWTIRLLAPFQDYQIGHAPRRMYFASCDTDTDTPKYFASYTVGTKVDSGYTGTSGAITVSQLNPATGALEVQSTHHYPECRSMHGIAVANDCATVAALCRIENTATGADYDAIANHSNSDWLTNENTCGNQAKMNDHMWLYEWDQGDLTEYPTKVIVHKSIGSWEYGQDYLRYGENDNSYGIALKATVGDQGDCHEADSYMVLDRSDYSFTKGRGWVWACATGHTTHNRPAYDPVTQKYGMLCSTDWNDDGISGEAEIAFHREDQSKVVIQHVPFYNSLWIKGGAGPLVPRDGGGFLGIIVGEPPPRGAGYDDTTPVELGLVTIDSAGNQVGDVNWIAKHDTAYYSWPQLASLGDDRYLLGWGEGYHAGTKENTNPDRNLSLRIPWTYWLMEIDGDGNQLTDPMEVTAAGWGEVNEMVPLGKGRVAWSYVPEDRRLEGSDEAPSCNQSTLIHYVYTAVTVSE